MREINLPFYSLEIVVSMAYLQVSAFLGVRLVCNISWNISLKYISALIK
jgi:hypothetical protein